jgi:hypothetical protein
MMPHRPIYQKKRFLFPLAFILFIGALVVWYVVDTSIAPPVIKDRSPLQWLVSEPDSGLWVCEGNWLKQNRYGLWELYVQGTPFERGVANGKLTHDLIAFQEEAFVNRLREMIPSENYLKFLKYFIYWFNRDLDEYLMQEFKEEIYGISFSADPEFNFIGNPYQRMLNYHSAHDIGHALQDLMLVGCTSFGVWDGFSADSGLIIGRNFDFYMGDEFAENKIVCFVRPDNGFGFMMVTWGGMTGAVSGINEKGLTVTINAAKSKIPLSARTPVSILAREILQYASTIDDALHMAQERETFVSESLLIGSGEENRAAIIEKTPFGIGLVEPDSGFIICSNHFQSDQFANDPLNIKGRDATASGYRFRRALQDFTEMKPLDEKKVAAVLRDRQGLDDRDIGMGNEKAINQLICHHSVIFKPAERLVWVSTSPWQLGSYVCYDLNKIFHTFVPLRQNIEITEWDKTIPSDPFQDSDTLRRFSRFKELRAILRDILTGDEQLKPDKSFFDEFLSSNPGYYETWSLTGDYYLQTDQSEKAAWYYRKALSLEIPGWNEKEKIIQHLAAAHDQIKSTDE